MVKTMFRRITKYILIVVVICVWVQCENAEDSSTENSDSMYQSSHSYNDTDTISIESIIYPQEGLVVGTTATLTVNVRYYFYSWTQAELQIGFNNEEPYSYTILSEYKTIVELEEGTYTFEVPVTPVTWESTPFRVYIVLFDQDNFKPLADVYKNVDVITVKK